MTKALVALGILIILIAAPACWGSTCPSPDEQAFFAAMPIFEEEITMGAQSLREHFDQSAARPPLLTSEAWKTDVAIGLSRMETGAQAILDRAPPASLFHIDSLHKSGAAKALEAVDIYEGAASRLAPAAIQGAIDLLESAAANWAEASSATEEFCKG